MTAVDKSGHNKAVHYIRASDLRIGWVFPALGARDRTVVVVLPKPWLARSETGTAGTLRSWPSQGDTPKFYYCYQGEVLTCGEAGQDEAVAFVLTKLYEYAVAESRGPSDEELEQQAAEEGMTLADIRAARRLFSSSRKPASSKQSKRKGASASNGDADNKESAATRESEPERDLQAALIRLLDTARPREWLEALAFQTDPLFREAIARHYIEVLKPVVPHMRRGYIERRERLTSPRGRVVASSAGRSEASGEPAIVCDYSDFEKDLPLHRVLVAALHEAAGVLSAAAEASEALQEAYGLRHQLQGIAGYPRSLARSTADHLHLSPAQIKRWHRPLQLARAVLNEWSPTDSNDHSDDTPDLTIPSASLWERVISKSLRAGGMVTLGDDHTEEDPNAARRISPPWELSNARNFRCDIVVERQSGKTYRHLILDAKYTTLLEFRNTKRPVVPVAHVRQVFAYGVLWQPVGPRSAQPSLSHRDVGLVYLKAAKEPEGPANIEQTECTKNGNADEQPIGYQGPRLTPDDGATPNWPGLFVLAMSFPSPADCESQARLDKYYEERGSEWSKLLPARAV